MRKVEASLFLALLTGVAATTPSYAQTTTDGRPGDEAMELAELVSPGSLMPFARSDKAWSALVERTLYNTSIIPNGSNLNDLNTVPCDHTLPECDRIAKEVGAKLIQDRKAFEAKEAQTFYAEYFERTLSSDQIAASAKFLRTGHGRAFAAALRSMASIGLAERVMRPNKNWDDAPYISEFRQRTATLPRDPARGRTVAPPTFVPRPQGGQ